MHVLLVGSDRERCGIAEHTEMMRVALQQLGHHVDVVAPGQLSEIPSLIHRNPYDVLHVNHHAALHAAFTPQWMLEASQSIATVVTQHDTFEERSIMLERGYPDFVGACHALIVHEEVGGLTAPRGKAALFRAKDKGSVSTEVYYIPQGIPEIALNTKPPMELPTDRPFVGTCGFNFPWKNYGQLVEIAKHAGWNVLLIAPGISDAELGALEAADDQLFVINTWLPRADVIAMLRQCNATAFLYQTGNSGTSAAIRLGVAAGRPVVAYPCRQFRDLMEDSLGAAAIIWAHNGAMDVAGALEAFDPREYEGGPEGAAGGAAQTSSRWEQKLAILRARDGWGEAAKAIAAVHLRVVKRMNGTA